MKIVQICPYDMTRPGGVQRHVRDLAAWCTAQGHETRIVAPPPPGQRASRRGNLVTLGRSRLTGAHGTGFEVSFAAPWSVSALAQELRGWGADLLHLHTPWTPLLAWQVWRSLRLPTLTTIHATLPRPDATGLTDRYIRRAARHFVARSAAVVVPSEAPLEMLRKLTPSLDAIVLPPTIDLSPWRENARSRSTEDPLHFVFLSRFEERKGIAVLLDAWKRAKPRLDDARLSIAGDGPLRDQVRAAAQADPSILYIGNLDDQDARALLASADLFAAPAPFGESFGLVLTEAMAAGAVPVAAANPGFQSVLTGPGAACLVPPGDAGAFAEKLVVLGTESDKRAGLAGWALDHSRSFDVATVGPRYLDLLKDVLAR